MSLQEAPAHQPYMANIIMNVPSTHKTDCMHCCQHQLSLYNITTLLTVTCLSNDHTHIGSQYSMNRSFGKAAAHAKAFANFCLAKCLRSTYNHLSWWPLCMMA